MNQTIKKFAKNKVRSGSFLWYSLWEAFVFPKRLREKKYGFIKSHFDYYRIKNLNQEKLKDRKLKKGWVTIVFTSAGRKEYLEKTIESLRNNFVYDRNKVLWYIIDDYPDSPETREYIESLTDFDLKIFNPANLGWGRSLNKIYSEITTEFVFHAEDDWLFLKPVPVEQMMCALNKNPYWRQLLLFRTIDDYDGKFKVVGNGYAEYSHKFSFNAHMTKTEQFIKNQPFPLNYVEMEYTLKLERSGLFVAGMLGYGESPYIEHLGITRKVANF